MRAPAFLVFRRSSVGVARRGAVAALSIAVMSVGWQAAMPGLAPSAVAVIGKTSNGAAPTSREGDSSGVQSRKKLAAGKACKSRHSKRKGTCGRKAVKVAKSKSAPAKAPKPSTPTVVPQSPLGRPGGDGSLAHLPSSGFLGSNLEYKRDISKAPAALDSAAVVANLAEQVRSRWGGTAAFNVWHYNTGFYQVSALTPRVRVAFDNCQKKPFLPPELYEARRGAVFVDVPIPVGAVPAAGTDGTLSLWDPVQDKFWELWKARQVDGVWQACWGGRIDGWSTSSGRFPGWTGVAASGLPIAAGVVGMTEMLEGRIDHALNLVVVYARHYSEFSYPASRSDGQLPAGTSGAVAEGQRLRLDPTLDVDKLGLSPVAKAVAKAAQKYGFIVTDKGGAVAVQAESGAGVQARTGINPWDGLLAGRASYSVMANFPWHRLQAIQMDYGR